MIRLVAALALLATLAPGAASAQSRRSGFTQPRTAFGPYFNPTQTPEWRQAGGNPLVYQQILERKQIAAQQKALAEQQKQLQKQQQAFEKWLKEQKAKKDKGQPYDPAYDRWLQQVEQARQAAARQARTRSGRMDAARARAGR